MEYVVVFETNVSKTLIYECEIWFIELFSDFQRICRCTNGILMYLSEYLEFSCTTMHSWNFHFMWRQILKQQAFWYSISKISWHLSEYSYSLAKIWNSVGYSYNLKLLGIFSFFRKIFPSSHSKSFLQSDTEIRQSTTFIPHNLPKLYICL